MTYNPNKPAANDDLSDSQGDIKSNFTVSNNVFLVDHYPFSNTTANKGKHNQVTTPLIIGSVHPATAAAEPKMYAMQDSANVGVLNYSRGPSSAVPTPLTSLQSPATPVTIGSGGTANILNFTNLARCTCILSVMDTVYATTIAPGVPAASTYSFVYWTGTAFMFKTTGTIIQVQNTGNILQIKNNTSVPVGALNNVYWTLQFLRLS